MSKIKCNYIDGMCGTSCSGEDGRACTLTLGECAYQEGYIDPKDAEITRLQTKVDELDNIRVKLVSTELRLRKALKDAEADCDTLQESEAALKGLIEKLWSISDDNEMDEVARDISIFDILCVYMKGGT